MDPVASKNVPPYHSPPTQDSTICPDTPGDRRRRHDMVRQQILGRGIRNPRVVRVMATLPRHIFTHPQERLAAYSDQAMASDCGQTISQPLIVAIMTEQLDPQPNDRILEIGTGTGYQTAILARLCAAVYTIEYIPELSTTAQARIQRLGFDNVYYRVGDGSSGWPEHAPFNGILVTAGAPMAPEPLLRQLADGGKLIIPIGDQHLQMLKCYQLRGHEIVARDILDCRFVPLRGQWGWK